MACNSFGQILTSNAWYGNGADTFWPTAANWSNNVVPTSGSLVILTNFGVSGVRGTNGSGVFVTPNMVVNTDTRIAALFVNNTNCVLGSANTIYHTLLISNGVTLAVSNSSAGTAPFFLNTNAIIQVASQSAAGNPSGIGSDLGINSVTYFTIEGAGGTLLVNSTNGATVFSRGNIFVGQGAIGLSVAPTVDALNAVLDMSALDNFICDANHIMIGDGGAAPYFFNRPAGTIYFAKTNNIHLAAVGAFQTASGGLMTGAMAQNNGGGLTRTGKFVLGLTNGIFCDTGVSLAVRGFSGWLGFNPSNAPGISTAYFRNRAGTGRQANWTVGNRITAGALSPISGEMDFSAGSVDAMVTTIGVGVNNSALQTIGALEFGAGVIDVNTLQLGIQSANSSGAVQGTISVSNTAVLKVNTSGTFGGAFGSPGPSFYARLNITDGGSVLFGSTAPLNIGVGSSTEINLLNGSQLQVLSIGSASAPLTSLVISSNSTLTIDRGFLSNPSSAPVVVSSLDVSGTNTINLLGQVLVKGRFPLIQYGSFANGSFANFQFGTNSPGVGGYLTNNLANSSIDFVVTNSGTAFLSWDGQTNAINVGNWDINITPNWQGGLKYLQSSIPGSLVQFDDTATGTASVTLITNVSPAIVSVTNDAKTYTFAGGFGIVGPGSLTKDGVGTLILANTAANSFSGGMSINAGTVQLSGTADRLPTSGALTLLDVSGALLDLNGQNQTLGSISGGGILGGNVNLGSATLTIRGGSGVYGGTISGAGSLVKNTSGLQTLSGGNLYTGGTTISNSSLLVINNNNGSGLGSGFVLVGTNGVLQLGNGVADGSVTYPYITNNGVLSLQPLLDYTLTNIIVGSGSVSKVIGAGSTTITITNDNFYSGGTSLGQGRIQISSPRALGTGPINLGNQFVDDTWLALSGGITVTNAISMPAKTGAIVPPVPHLRNLDGTNTLTGNITLAGSTVFGISSDGGSLVIAGNLINNQVAGPGRVFLEGEGNGVYAGPFNQAAGSALQLEKVGGGTWTLSGANTYSGATVITAGKLIVNGSIRNSSGVTTQNPISGPAALAGTGLIAAAVTNVGIIFPGDDGVIGTLTISNKLICDGAGAITMDINTNGNDQIRGLTLVDFHGALTINLLGTLTNNSVFKLFSAGSYSGTFDAGINLPSLLGTGLDWDTSYLAVDGTLRATNGAAISAPEITSAGFSGGKFVLSGSVGLQVAPYTVLATTNLALPLANWSNLGEGTFTNGAFTFADALATNYPARFYRLSTITP